MITTRREFSNGGLLALAAAASSGLAGAAGPPESRLTRANLLAADQRYRAYRRMRFGPDGKPIFWWMTGRRYGIIDNVMTPFLDMQVGSMHLTRELGAGRFSVTTAAAIYYTHVDTGELLETWLNPITGRNVVFRYAAPSPSTVTYSYASGVESEPTSAGMRAERVHHVGPVDVVGPDVWLREETAIVLTPIAPTAQGAAAAPAQAGVALPLPMRVHDMYTLQSPLAALLDDKQQFVPALAQFNDFNSWSPRFEMGDRPGTSVSRCAGRKESTLEQMPSRYLELARRLHPEAFKNPMATLGQG